MKNFGLPKFMLLKHGALPQFLVCEVSPTLERGKHRNKLLDEKGAHKALLAAPMADGGRLKRRRFTHLGDETPLP